MKHCIPFSINSCWLLAHEQKVIKSLQLLEVFPVTYKLLSASGVFCEYMFTMMLSFEYTANLVHSLI